MSGQPDERIREAHETIDMLRRVHPSNDPDVATIAELHELHAAHERKRGRIEQAEAAARRAARARKHG